MPNLYRAAGADPERYTLANALCHRSHKARAARLGAIGDPGRLSRTQLLEVARQCQEAGLSLLAYSHFWRARGSAPATLSANKDLLMASCDDLTEADEAGALGWKTAAIVSEASTPVVITPQGRRLLVCPAPRTGYKTTCNTCRLCSPSRLTKYDGIAFVDHSPKARAARREKGEIAASAGSRGSVPQPEFMAHQPAATGSITSSLYRSPKSEENRMASAKRVASAKRSDIVRRLRTQRQAILSESRRAGQRAGEAWATRDADYRAIVRLVGVWKLAPAPLAEVVARAMRDADRVAFDEITCDIEDEALDAEAYWTAFLSGVEAVWSLVKEDVECVESSGGPSGRQPTTSALVGAATRLAAPRPARARA